MKKIISRNNYSLFLLPVVLTVILMLLIILLQKSSESRIRALKSTVLSFSPASSQTAPVSVTTFENIPMDIMVDPGNNMVSLIRLEIEYDSAKLQPNGTTPFVRNTTAFPVALEGPVYSTGKVAIVLSIGSDPTRAITAVTKVGTINLIASQVVNGTTYVRFSTRTEAYSVGPNDQAQENVLSSAQQAFIAVRSGTITPSVTLTPFPTTNLTPSISPSPVTSNTPTPRPPTLTPWDNPSPTNWPASPTPWNNLTPTSTGTISLGMTLRFHGIGSAGDNANPGKSTLSNKNPVHQERPLNIQIVNTDNEIVATKLTTAFYNTDKGVFFSNAIINEPLTPGDYVVKVKTDRYLRKLMPGFITISPGKTNNIAVTDLVAGDINGDNALNILDYNILYDCGYGAIKPLQMLNEKSLYNSDECIAHDDREFADLNDNATIEASDYNLFLRELSVQFGE